MNVSFALSKIVLLAMAAGAILVVGVVVALVMTAGRSRGGDD